jgi:tetratricopeptide (TPR) repeat protein
MSMKRYADAEQAFRKALQLDPGLAAAYNGYAAARLAQGAWEEAYQAWQKALAADSDYAMAHYNLGVELYRRGRKQEARTHLLRYLELMGARISAEEHQKIEQMLRDIGATKG